MGLCGRGDVRTLHLNPVAPLSDVSGPVYRAYLIIYIALVGVQCHGVGVGGLSDAALIADKEVVGGVVGPGHVEIVDVIVFGSGLPVEVDECPLTGQHRAVALQVYLAHVGPQVAGHLRRLEVRQADLLHEGLRLVARVVVG